MTLSLFRKITTPLNIVFFLHLLVVGLIAMGVVEREASLALLAVVLFFLIFSPLEDGVLYTVRSIPFFVALPLTESFDSFNMWRVVISVVFVKWLLGRNMNVKEWMRSFPSTHSKNSGSPRGIRGATWLPSTKFGAGRTSSLKRYWEHYQFEFFAVIVVILSLVSLLGAVDLMAGLKRIIYFGTMLLVYPVVKSLISQHPYTLKRIVKNIAAGMLIVVAVGYLQLITAFNWDFMRFVNFWALKAQYGFYGEAWSSIVYHANTWFAYLGGGGLRLRIFSTFPDSHSMPLYLLMGLIPFLTIIVSRLNLETLGKPNFLLKKVRLPKIKNLTRSDLVRLLLFLCVPLILFVIILSGTRGIWVSAVFPLLTALGLLVWRGSAHRKLVAIGLAVLFMFLLLLLVASYLYTFPQFRPGAEEEDEAFLARLRSSLSATEVSNSARIEIWLKTLVSVKKAPLLGVGIGNFPVALDQDVSLQKAGSSAHNLYLNMMAEIGFLGGVLFALALFLLLEHSFQIFIKSRDELYRIFGFFALLFLVWVFGYSLTDAALFDERAFLMFVVTAAMVTAVYNKIKNAQS